MTVTDLESNEKPPKEIVIKGKLRFEMMRYLEEEHKYVIIGVGNVPKKKRLFVWKSGIKGMEFGEYFIDPHEMFDDGKLKYDVNWCEPINPTAQKPKRKKEVSIILAASKMAQRIKVATIITKFIFNKQYLAFFLISILIGSFSFLSLEPLLHLTPTTVVHWLNQPPRIR